MVTWKAGTVAQQEWLKGIAATLFSTRVAITQIALLSDSWQMNQLTEVHDDYQHNSLYANKINNQSGLQVLNMKITWWFWGKPESREMMITGYLHLAY